MLNIALVQAILHSLCAKCLIGTPWDTYYCGTGSFKNQNESTMGFLMRKCLAQIDRPERLGLVETEFRRYS